MSMEPRTTTYRRSFATKWEESLGSGKPPSVQFWAQDGGAGWQRSTGRAT